MSPDHIAFERAIAAAPEDMAPRMVYSDWLQEQGDERWEILLDKDLQEFITRWAKNAKKQGILYSPGSLFPYVNIAKAFKLFSLRLPLPFHHTDFTYTARALRNSRTSRSV